MPLDGHSYLVSQGWSGKGSGLRTGAISRPLAIPQKKTLAGLGKDRDDAFPFWDHLFTVAAKTIQVKIHKDEDDSNNTDSDASVVMPALTRTSTGILSNKRPMAGTPASSGASTPGAEASSSSIGSHTNLIARAKRDAARKGLYSRFFRGPVLGPDDDVPETKIASTSVISEAEITKRDILVTVDRKDVVMSDEDDRKKERRGKKEKKRKEKEISKEEKRAKKAKKAEKKETKETKEKTRKGKGKELETAQAEGSTERDMEAVDDGADSKVSKKRKRMIDGEAASEDISLAEEKKERKKKKKVRSSRIQDISHIEDAALRSETKEETKEKRRQRKEEKRRRKEAEALSS